MQPPIGRRGFIQSAAATGSFLACYSAIDRSRAEVPVRITPPVVDKLTIQAVVDTSHDVFISGNSVEGVGIERVRSPARSTAARWTASGGCRCIWSPARARKHAAICWIRVHPGGSRQQPGAIEIDPAALDALILSHGHLDHFGGLAGFLQANRSKMREDLLLYVGGEDTFCRRLQQQADGSFAPYGVLDRHILKALKVQPVLSELPMIIEDHAFTTGIIPRTSIETVLPNTFVVFGQQDGVGCDTIKYGDDHHFNRRRTGRQAGPRSAVHEHATCFQVGDRGLVVITSCGHGGIINTIQRAQDITGIEKIHALCGGFHLAPAQPEYLDSIMAELTKLPIDHVIPMHCSGSNFIEAAKREMPEKLILCTTGSRFTFSA